MPPCPTCDGFSKDTGPCLYCRRHTEPETAEVFSPMPTNAKEIGRAGIAQARAVLHKDKQ